MSSYTTHLDKLERDHYWKKWLCRVPKKWLCHVPAHKILGKQHTASTVPANVSLSSVFYRALGKYFAES